MNYELCKKLKDAGFPQETYYGTISLMEINSGKEVSEKVKSPPLSQLIKACEEYIKEENVVTFRLRAWIRNNKKYWYAGNVNIETDGFDSPEEAVANLWLFLNKYEK